MVEGVFIVDTRESMARGRESPGERGQKEPGRVRRKDKGEQQRELPPKRTSLGQEIAQEADIAKMAKL